LTGHIWLGNCPLKHVIEGKMEERTEVTGRGERRGSHWTSLKE